MFPSPITGRCYHASPIQQDYIRLAGRKLGLGDIGWHTFRHTYRSWLDSVGTSMGVQQKLLAECLLCTSGPEGCFRETSALSDSQGLRNGRRADLYWHLKR